MTEPARPPECEVAVKGSGWGRFGCAAGIDEFTELRWITIQSGVPHYRSEAATGLLRRPRRAPPRPTHHRRQVP